MAATLGKLAFLAVKTLVVQFSNKKSSGTTLSPPESTLLLALSSSTPTNPLPPSSFLCFLLSCLHHLSPLLRLIPTTTHPRKPHPSGLHPNLRSAYLTSTAGDHFSQTFLHISHDTILELTQIAISILLQPLFKLSLVRFLFRDAHSVLCQCHSVNASYWADTSGTRYPGHLPRYSY